MTSNESFPAGNAASLDRTLLGSDKDDTTKVFASKTQEENKTTTSSGETTWLVAEKEGMDSSSSEIGEAGESYIPGEGSALTNSAAEPHHKGRIRSFTRRGGRMVRQYERVLKEHGSDYVLQLPPGEAHTTIDPRVPVDLNEVFARQAPLVVEIGPGSGEQLISYALSHPERNILAFEAWNVAIARCVANASKAGVTNVRLIEADAAQALPAIFAWEHNPRAVEIWTFFPDPWRKSRHRKRRLVTKAFAEDISNALEDKGLWRLATDWDDYAWQMRDEVEDSGLFLNLHLGERPDPNDPQPERGGFAPRWEERFMTRFEQRGLDAGRTIHDFTFEKILKR